MSALVPDAPRLRMARHLRDLLNQANELIINLEDNGYEFDLAMQYAFEEAPEGIDDPMNIPSPSTSFETIIAGVQLYIKHLEDGTPIN